MYLFQTQVYKHTHPSQNLKTCLSIAFMHTVFVAHSGKLGGGGELHKNLIAGTSNLVKVNKEHFIFKITYTPSSKWLSHPSLINKC